MEQNKYQTLISFWFFFLHQVQWHCWTLQDLPEQQWVLWIYRGQSGQILADRTSGPLQPRVSEGAQPHAGHLPPVPSVRGPRWQLRGLPPHAARLTELPQIASFNPNPAMLAGATQLTMSFTSGRPPNGYHDNKSIVLGEKWSPSETMAVCAMPQFIDILRELLRSKMWYDPKEKHKRREESSASQKQVQMDDRVYDFIECLRDACVFSK